MRNARSLAGLFGVAFVVIGVLGFIPGVVSDYGELRWWRTGSGAELFGLFGTSVFHNLLYLGLGIVGLVAARSAAGSRAYLTGGGVLLVALGVYGLLIDRSGDANVIPVNRADDWLHLGLGVAMVYAGLAVTLAAPRPAAAT
jgi:Domain of unknown function (DUF4383)